MEDLLDQLIKQAELSKLTNIQKEATEAKDILESPKGLAKKSPSQLRCDFLKLFQTTLETKLPKLTNLAVIGFHRLLRDNQFHGNNKDEDESCWMVEQFMNAMDSLPNQTEDVQTELLKVILSLCCLQGLLLSGEQIVGILGVCGLANGRGNSLMKSASQAASSQAITAFISYLNQEIINKEDNDKEPAKGGDVDDGATFTFDQLIPIVYFISEKLTDAHKHKEDKKYIEIPPVFVLECANTLLQKLSNDIDSRCGELKSENALPQFLSSALVSAFWQRLCPSLISLLGVPKSCDVPRGTGRMQGQMGRGSGTSNSNLLCTNHDAKLAYSVACSLVKAMGNIGELRPVLESLFHRMLLYPPPQNRYIALKCVAELLKSPRILVKLAGPIVHLETRNPYQCDLALLRLIMDSLIECSNSNSTDLYHPLINCICGMLLSLESISQGDVLTKSQIAEINILYQTLEEGDYSGPMIYEHQSGFSKYEFSTDSEDDPSDNDLSQDASVKNEEHSQDKKSESLGECHSVSSGNTESAEESGDDFNDDILGSQQRSEKIKQLSKQDDLSIMSAFDSEKECQNARHFCSSLCSLLPHLLAIKSTIEVDQAIVEYSSNYCQAVCNNSGEDDGRRVIINADGIYLSTYAALSLNLKLIASGFYCQTSSEVPLSKEQFVSTIYASGVLVYLSHAWIGELYQLVLKDSFLQRAGYSPQSPYNCALINLLTDLENVSFCCTTIDLDGLGSTEVGSQMISDYRRLVKAAKNIPKTNAVLAGQKLSRRILTCCWESIVSIQGSLLTLLESRGGILEPILLLLTGEVIRKEESKRSQDLLILCLNSLQSLARLANILGLQKRCGVVFSLLSSACLPTDEQNIIPIPKRKLTSPLRSKHDLRLHRAHVLSFYVMMECGLELGSHTPDCWSHLFRCCLYITELERRYFSGLEGRSYYLTGTAKPRERSKMESSNDFLSEETVYCDGQFGAAIAETSIEEILAESGQEAPSGGFLSSQLSTKALYCLYRLIDKFFDSAANQLNLIALENFLRQLCTASEGQLFSKYVFKARKRKLFWWKKKNSDNSEFIVVEESLLLNRLTESVLKIVRSGRPLIHIMRVWSIVGPHFLEAACHQDRNVSKKAISCIHDVINILLSNQIELAHFHFNEALFKPFENLLRLELCSLEVQDQIVSSICEFVESCNVEIKSGWRPLFGALKCIRIPPTKLDKSHSSLDGMNSESVGHLGVVRDVFDAFLSTDNLLVFANAALDCILCLLNHIKGSGDLSEKSDIGCYDNADVVLCLNGLRYLHRIVTILASMYLIPACPVFACTLRSSEEFDPDLVDATLPNIDEINLWALKKKIVGECGREMEICYSCLWPSKKNFTSLRSLDDGTGILYVWFALLEGLVNIAINCPQKHQPHVVDTLFGLIHTLPKCPGANFGLYCINGLLLPSLQQWLRKFPSGGESSSIQPFKQYVGLTTDLVVEYVSIAATEDKTEHDSMTSLMFRQCLLVLVECVGHPSEISRLGCSCLRHISLSCGSILPGHLWDTFAWGIHRASQVCLYPLYQLMEQFERESLNFYGDFGQVKVAAKRDSTIQENIRLMQIAQQVFLLDAQRMENSLESNPEAEERSFIFLFCNEKYNLEDSMENFEANAVRISFKSIVLGLLTHQRILETLGLMLVHESFHVIPSIANVIQQTAVTKIAHRSSTKDSLPGVMTFLAREQIIVLLECVNLCYKFSEEFDDRPGLKFLIQKICQADRAANLYQQAGASWAIRILALFNLILAEVKHGLTLEGMKVILDKNSHTILNNGESNPIETPFEEQKFVYVRLFTEACSELCSKYISLIGNHSDSRFDADRHGPVYFLNVSSDDFLTEHRQQLKNWTKILNDYNKDDNMDKNVKDSQSEGQQNMSSELLKAAVMQGVASFEETSSSLPVTMTVGAFGNDSELENDIGSTLSSPEDHSENSFDSNEPQRTANESAEKDQVYNVATHKDVANVVGAYRKRKNIHSLPPSRPAAKSIDNGCCTDQIPPQIHQQRARSLMKDGEAQMNVLTEMIITIFDLAMKLADHELRPILPMILPIMRSLIAYAQDANLRKVLSEMLQRVAVLYGFSVKE